MKNLLVFLTILTICPVAAPAVQLSSVSATTGTVERLGTVSFPISCTASSQVAFNRGVALLHDFWYTEAQRQFERIAQSDPNCAMAHWGVAMSLFHQIWARPDTDAMKLGWTQMQAAESLHAGTARERAYISALAAYYRPGTETYSERIGAYSSAMGRLYAQYPGDVDAGAFFALSLLAAKAPGDTSLTNERKAMAVLAPLFVSHPDNPGVDHYIVHSCDNPAMAREGLAAANHYGQIAPSGPHAAHMPGHIYARLGMWPQDITAQLDSIRASQLAALRGESGILDEPHSYDFLIYAYLQSGQDAKAKAALANALAALTKIAAMRDQGSRYFSGRVSYYRNELPAFYSLEMGDWKTAAAMKPVAGSLPQSAVLVYWARAVADGHLRRPTQAQADLARYDELMTEIGKGPHAYMAEGTGNEITRDEMMAWTAFAEGNQAEAFQNMRAAADVQDKVGQQEVDIPAREMLGDMLLKSGHPRQALAEYRVSLKFSPNRFNGLYNAGRAAEAAGNRQQEKFYYSALLKSTNNGANSTRPELAHARKFVSSIQMAAK